MMMFAVSAFAASPKKVVVVLAPGFEEIEASAPIDIMRRAGLEVTIAGLDDVNVKGANGITFVADKLLAGIDIMTYDGIVLPGGLPGAENLAKSAMLNAMVKTATKERKIVAAICAAPALVLAPLGILNGHHATCYPGMEKNFPEKTVYEKADVVTDRSIITASGPGTAMLFGLAIVERMVDKKTAAGLEEGLLVK